MGSIRVIKKKNGKESFHAEVRLMGIIERKAWRTRTAANDWIQKTEAAIKDGRYKTQKAFRKYRVTDLIERFIDQLSKNHKYYEQRVQLLARWQSELGHLLLSDLSSSHIAEVRDKLLNETTTKKKLRTPSTVNRYLAAISKACEVAIKEWGWLETNPVRNVRKPSENPARTRILSPEERVRLIEACKNSSHPTLLPIVSLALTTGMRAGEILNLKWRDIDFDRESITMERTKNGDSRTIPLTSEVSEIFKNLPNYKALRDELVFRSQKNPSNPVSFRKAFRRALHLAKIENFRFHDLRHVTASYLSAMGATTSEIMAILGHRTPQMTYRYTQTLPARLKDVMNKYSSSVFQEDEFQRVKK